MPSGHIREYILHLTRCRQAIVRPSCTIRINIVCKTTSSYIFVSASGIIVSYSCVHRVTIGGLRVCAGSILAFYQIRDENRAKFKISYSCGHRVQNRLGMTPPLTEERQFFRTSPPSMMLTEIVWAMLHIFG